MGRAAAAAHRRDAVVAGESVYPSPGTTSPGNSAQNHGPWHIYRCYEYLGERQKDSLAFKGALKDG